MPKLDTLILVKSMIKTRSFKNPFSGLVSVGSAGAGGAASRKKYQKAGRANSAPEIFPCDTSDRSVKFFSFVYQDLAFKIA